MAREHDARGRYGQRVEDDGRVTIFDTANDDAWIRSDTAIGLGWRT